MKVDSRRKLPRIGRWARLMAAILLLLIGTGIGSTPARAQTAACVTAQPGNVDQKTAVPIAVPGCVNVANDPSAQTVFSWTVTAAQATTFWSMNVTGIGGSSEVLSLFRVLGDATVSPTKIADFNETTLGSGIQTNPFLLQPGAYFVGVATTGVGAYTLSISVAGALPKNGDSEPNDSAAQATKVKARFALSGDLQASDDWYAWTLSKADETKHWTLSLQTAIGETSSFRLLDATGNQLASIQVDALGGADLADLGLAAGTYTIQITYQTDHPAPYALQTTSGSDRAPGTENEPNDNLLLANPFDRSNSIYGHVSNANDQDYFRFHVDKTLATQVFDLTLMASAGLDRKICLVDSDGGDTLCAENTTGLVALAGLSLLEGDHVFRVAGDASTTDEYSVDLLVTGTADPGQETLPNDRVLNANALNGSNEIKGKFGLGTGDRHVFKLHTAGDPRLWQIQAVGGGIQSLRIVDASDVTLAEGTVSSDGTYAAVNDQFFTPGDHWIAVQGANSAFSVAATAMGAPDPNGEREPNNDLEHSERCRCVPVQSRGYRARPDQNPIASRRANSRGPAMERRVRAEFGRPQGGRADRLGRSAQSGRLQHSAARGHARRTEISALVRTCRSLRAGRRSRAEQHLR